MAMLYYQRLLSPLIRDALQSMPVVVLGGARQTGKSTILKKDPLFSGRTYQTCDSPQTALALKASPDTFLNSFSSISLDEAQREPHLFLAIKRLVDSERVAGRFLISGSAQFLLLKGLGDSLAGRAFYLKLFPVTLHEIYRTDSVPFIWKIFKSDTPGRLFRETEIPDLDHVRWIARGMFPELVWNQSVNSSIWYGGYEAAYLERDLREFAPGVDPLSMQRLIRIAAARNSALLNQSAIASDAGLTTMSTGRYLHYLEMSGLVQRIPPWFSNASQRWVKSPKLLFTDTALAAHSAGLSTALEDPANPAFGRIFEGFTLQNLYALCSASFPPIEIYHVRGATGLEIDALLVQNERKMCIEIKSSVIVSVKDCLHIQKLMSTDTTIFMGVIAYRGIECFELLPSIWAVPVDLLLS